MPNVSAPVPPVPATAPAGNDNAGMDARQFNFDMRGSNLTEGQARAMFTQALGAYDSHLKRNVGGYVADNKRRFG